jgi:hypothetical protein
MPTEYDVVIHSDAMEVLFQMRGSQRRELIRFFDRLVSRPSAVGDFEEEDAVGRPTK